MWLCWKVFNLHQAKPKHDHEAPDCRSEMSDQPHVTQILSTRFHSKLFLFHLCPFLFKIEMHQSDKSITFQTKKSKGLSDVLCIYIILLHELFLQNSKLFIGGIIICRWRSHQFFMNTQKIKWKKKEKKKQQFNLFFLQLEKCLL